mgnify:CR=1 FL=1
MVNYQKGKIYKIISPHTDKCYVGSTTKDRLSNRLAHHRSDFKNGKNTTSSKYILELGDYEIVLLELFPCNSKDELHARERHYIETLDCVNKQKPLRSKLEHYQDNKDIIIQKCKEYYQANKDDIKEYKKEYQLKNKDKIKEIQKEYYQDNKDKLKEKQKEYRLQNKDKFKEINKVKITCECGCLIRKSNILKHKQSKKHLDLIQSSL